jgi:hypothetical protein
MKFEEKLKLAKNPKTPPETLAKLAGDEDWPIRYAIARNPSTPPATLAELAGDEDCFVRRMVKQNPNTPKTKGTE